jgi:hypothetical protein
MVKTIPCRKAGVFADARFLAEIVAGYLFIV